MMRELHVRGSLHFWDLSGFMGLGYYLRVANHALGMGPTSYY